MQTSLWGDEFNITDNTEEILDKIKSPKKLKDIATKKKINSSKVSDEEKIRLIEEDVHSILGSYADDTISITSYDEFVHYIDKAIENNVIAIDTETNNTLDVINCKIMGLCLYTPGMKNAYIPVNHYKVITNYACINEFEERCEIKLENQITEEQIGVQLKRLKDVHKIFHNATFDIEVIQNTCGVRLDAYWDTMVAAKILDENELAGLKSQYKLHINPDQDKYDIEHLFKKMPYGIFDPELFALYAATDAYMTYKLYKYQEEQFDKIENKGLYEVFRTVEMPMIDVIVGMETRGIEIDKEYAAKMSVEYHKNLELIQKDIDKALEELRPKIEQWRLTPEANSRPKTKSKSGFGKSKNEQLTDPVNLDSPTQMAILLYDILDVGVIDKKAPRGTGADILEELAPKIPLCQLLLDKRGVDILLSTFIDKIPEEVKEKTGRLHARFNQYGAKTGRISSSDPKQNWAVL